MNAITLDRGDEAVRIDEAHDQFGHLHPAEHGAEAAFGVAGRVDLDLYEAVSRAVASQLPPLACTPMVPLA